MTKQIILKVDGGIVDAITIPQGVEVLVRDYDMVNSIDNELIQNDNTGKEYVEIIFEETEYA
jgi:hypothetical protein